MDVIILQYLDKVEFLKEVISFFFEEPKMRSLFPCINQLALAYSELRTQARARIPMQFGYNIFWNHIISRVAKGQAWYFVH